MPTILDLAYPFSGRWLTQNSPANRVPSHGTARYATSFAIDIVPVDESGRTAPLTFASLWHPEPAALFPGFARPILSPVDGVVVAVHSSEPDHAASEACHRSTTPSHKPAGQRQAGGRSPATT